MARARVGYSSLPPGESSPGGRATGLDIATGMMARLRRRSARAGGANLDAVVGEASALPFRSSGFDLFYLRAVLGELPDRASALAECRRVLRPGGRLVIVEGLLDPHRHSLAVVRDLATAAGLRPTQEQEGAFRLRRYLRPGGFLNVLSRGEWDRHATSPDGEAVARLRDPVAHTGGVRYPVVADGRERREMVLPEHAEHEFERHPLLAMSILACHRRRLPIGLRWPTSATDL